MNKNKTKVTWRSLIIGVAYLFFCCFVFFLVATIGIDLVFSGRIKLDKQTVMDVVVISIIAGVAGGLGSWIFAKIDERKSQD